MNRTNIPGLTLPLLLACAYPATATENPIEELVITASPHGKRIDEVAGAVGVLDQKTLQREAAATLGDTLQRQPGINSSSFGPGVGAPVIRGLGGTRVEILQNGTTVTDAADVSADHGISVEPLLADRIEILRGPATLRFGPGAIGGVVNVIDNAIHTTPFSGVAGAGEVRHDTNSHGNTAVLRLDAGTGPWILHTSAVQRDSNDIEIPSRAAIDDDSSKGFLANTDNDSDSWSLGLSHVRDRLVLGLSARHLNNDYGIPPGGHSHEEPEHDNDHGHEDMEAPITDEQDAENTHGDLFTRIDMSQRSYAGKILLRDLDGWAERLQLDLNRTDYGHRELEIDEHATEVGTVFNVDSDEARAELGLAPLHGWLNTIGAHYQQRDFDARGEEAFVPPSTTRNRGIYWLTDRELGSGALTLGLRHDEQKLNSPDIDSISHDSINASISYLYPLSAQQRLDVVLSHTERAPNAQELLSDGEHVATRSYEVGDPRLSTESAWNLELNWHYSGPIDAQLSLFHRRFGDFIYAADTGLRFSHDRHDAGFTGVDACSNALAEFDNEEDVFASAPTCFAYQQADARFTGFESELGLPLGDTHSVQLWADYVRARFDRPVDGDRDIPRIPAARVGLHWDWSSGPWTTRFSLTQAFSQNDAGANQNSTDGYTRVDAHVDYSAENWSVFIKGRNLSDQEIRNAISFLREIAPEPGRSLVIGASYQF